MSLSIVHNMMAMNASRQNRIQERRKTKEMEKLSSGYRINRSADDAAGLQISEKMRSQIRGLNRACDNIQDGISYVQVADGALGEVHDMLHRIRELSIQSANDTNTPEERYAINEEIKQIKSEMSRIFTDTEFNNKKIWTGERQVKNVILGTEKAYAVTMSAFSKSSVITNTNRGAVPETYYRLQADENGIVVSWKGYDGIDYETDVIPYDAELAGSHSFTLSDYMDYTKYPAAEGIDFTYTYNVREEATFDDMVNSLNGKTVSRTLAPSEYVEKFPNVSGISFSVDINYDALLVSDKDFEAADDDFIKETSQTNMTNDPTDAGNSATAWEFTLDMENIGTVKATSYSTRYYATTAEPDKAKWWYTVTSSNGSTHNYVYSKYPSPSNGTLDSVCHALDRTDGLSLATDAVYGGIIEVSFRLTADTPYICEDGATATSVGTMTMSISVGSADTSDTIKERLAKLTGIDIYDNVAQTMVTASNNNTTGGVKVDIPSYGYEYEYRHNLHIQSGANSGDSILISYDGLTVGALGLDGKDVMTAEKANEMISAVDHAISIISRQRSTFGAYQNRLEYAKSVDDNTAENLQAAESRIRDADMAEAMIEYSKSELLIQAGQMMLAQANKLPEAVIGLLQ